MPATDTFERGYFVDLAYDRGFESKEEMEFMGDLYDYLLTLGDNDPYELNEFLGEIESMDFKYEEDLKTFVEKVDQVMSDSDCNFPEELKEKCKKILLPKYRSIVLKEKNEENNVILPDEDEDERGDEVIVRDEETEYFVAKNVATEKKKTDRELEIEARAEELRGEPALGDDKKTELQQIESELEGYKERRGEYQLNTKSEFAKKTDLNTFIKNARKNGWVAPGDQEALIKLYMISERVNYKELNDDLERINSDNFALNAIEKMRFKERILKQTLLEMYRKQKSLTSTLVFNILDGIEYISQEEIDARYEEIFDTERPKTKKEIEFEKSKANYPEGTLFAADYDRETFLSIAEKNGWCEWCDDRLLRDLFEYKEHNNWEDNPEIDNILHIALNKQAWKMADRKTYLEQFEQAIKEIKKSKGIRLSADKEYMDGLSYSLGHMWNIDQNTLDESYEKLFNKPREKSKEELEEDKKKLEQQYVETEELLSGFYNKGALPRQVIFDKDLKMEEEDYIKAAEAKGWIYKGDKEALSILYNVARNSGNKELFDALNMIIKTDALNLEARNSASAQLEKLVNKLIAESDEDIKNHNLEAIYRGEKISVHGQDLINLKKIQQEKLLVGNITEKDFNTLLQAVKEARAEEERKAAEAKAAEKAAAHEAFVQTKKDATLADNEKPVVKSKEETLTGTDKNQQEDIAGRVQKMSADNKKRAEEARKAEEERKAAEARIKEEQKAAAHDAFVQTQKDATLADNEKLVGRSKEEDIAGRRRALKENQQVVDIEAQIHKMAERAEKNRKRDEERRKAEINQQIKDNATRQLHNNEKSALTQGYNLGRDLIGTYTIWKQSVINQLTSIKTRLTDSIPDDDDYIDYGNEYLDAIQGCIDALGNPENTNQNIYEAINNLYNKSAQIIQTIGPVNNIREDAPNAFMKFFSETAQKTAASSQHILMDYTTLKKWFKSTGIETAEGKDFNDASIKDIDSTLFNLNNKYQFEQNRVISNTNDLAKNLEKKAKLKMNLITAVEKKYKVKSNISFTTKDAKSYIAINANPTVEEAAKHYVLTGILNDIMSIKAVAGKEYLKNIKTSLESGALDKEIKNMAKNPVFAALVKAYPGAYYDKMKQVEKDSKEMKAEFGAELSHIKDTGLANFVINGVKVMESVEENGIVTERERYMKDSLIGADREDYLDQVYSRLGQVVISQILTDPKNTHLLQGIAAGQYDIYDMKEKITDYIKQKNTFGLDDVMLDVQKLNAKLENGDIKKTIMDKVIKNIKPKNLAEQEANILNENNNIINNDAKKTVVIRK
jgi:hypothetical protein